MVKKNRSLKLLWQISLGCFILAGLTGFLFRLRFAGWTPFGLNLENIRHAHSHLIFFCWAVPLPMYFIIRRLKAKSPERSQNLLVNRMAFASLVLGLASYPFFLLYGYRPVPIGGLDLPLSVILSGLVMLCWYGFIAGYWKERKFIDSDLPLQFIDGALVMLFICSLGAWGVAVVQFTAVPNPLWAKALTHFFLATFTEGWVVMILLGLIYQHLEIELNQIRFGSGLLVGMILFGASLTFPYGISEGLLSPPLVWVARVGGVMAALELGFNLYEISGVVEPKWYW